MNMLASLAFTFVIAVTTVALGQSEKAGQSLDLITDSEAYAIYAAVVPGMWASGSRPQEQILIRRETEDVFAMKDRTCDSLLPKRDPEWAEIQKTFLLENARRKVLPVALPIDGSYRLMTLAEIEASDARLAVKYPGIYNQLPESLEYVAVSSVGFNADKTKAMVYMRLREKGELLGLELRDGKWITAPNSSICTWIA